MAPKTCHNVDEVNKSGPEELGTQKAVGNKQRQTNSEKATSLYD